MLRNLFQLTTSGIAMAICLMVVTEVAARTDGQDDNAPNIVFIFADDLSYEAVGALGNAEVETPNIDRLAKRGMVFDHAYNMGSWSGAVCVASRTMLNTGRMIWHANAVYDTTEQERQAGRLWSEHLRQAGYETYFTGKWHVKADPEKAFDHTQHVRGGMPGQTNAGYNRPIDGQSDPWDPSDPSFGGYWKGGKHWSEIVGDDAVDYLRQAGEKEKPFFMYLAFNAPHDPRQSPREFVERYPADQILVPENFLPIYPYHDKIGCGKNLRDEKLAPFPRTEHAIQVHRQEYYAIITHMDQQIGRILDAIEATGKAKNTWIVFTADHGLAVGHHGLVGKQNMYDHSVRVPFIIAGPEVTPASQSSTPIYLQDVMPTTLALAGVEKPEHVEFKSLLPLIRGETNEHYDAVYGAYLQLQRMITDDGYKLIVYPEANVVRLYRIAEDPLEMHDLAEEKDAQPIVKRLFRRLVNMQAQLDDQLNLTETFPQYAE